MAQSCADVLTMIMDTAKQSRASRYHERDVAEREGLLPIGASEKIKFSEQKSVVVEPYKVTAIDGEKDPLPISIGTIEELLNVFQRKERW